MLDPNEKEVQDYLHTLGFQCKPFSKAEKRNRATPDFRIFCNNEFRFFCEVKSIDYDKWSDRQISGSSENVFISERPDPHFNRITDDIHQAVKQFDSVNPHITFPNVLAFVNNDRHCNLDDLVGVLTGNQFAKDWEALSIYLKYSEGRIHEEKNRIHLFLWLDLSKMKYARLFAEVDKTHFQNLCKWFSTNPNALPNIGG